MNTYRVRLLCCGLAAASCLLPSCSRKPEITPEVLEAIAFAKEFERQLDQPRVDQPSLALAVDPGALVDSKAVGEALHARGVGGKDATYHVEVQNHAVGELRLERSCRVLWTAVGADGERVASGAFTVAVYDRDLFLAASKYEPPLAGIGDAGLIEHGVPSALVADVAVTVRDSTASPSLSIELLRDVVRRLRH